jgi:hypothetical protein
MAKSLFLSLHSSRYGDNLAAIQDHMDNTTALHTAARRYCQQRFSDWCQTYKELQDREETQVAHMFKPGWRYSDEACRTFPRYRLDAAI